MRHAMGGDLSTPALCTRRAALAMRCFQASYNIGRRDRPFTALGTSASGAGAKELRNLC